MFTMRHDYSWTENALARGATLILLACCVTSLVMICVTDSPATCWTPAQFEPAQVNYANQYCFQKQQIYPFLFHALDLVPTRNSGKEHLKVLTFHQWVPLFLGMACLLCLLPHALWRVFSRLLWVDVHPFLHSLRHSQPDSGTLGGSSSSFLQVSLKRGSWVLTAAALTRKLAVCAVCLLELVLMGAVFRPLLSAFPGWEYAWGSWREGIVALPELFICDFNTVVYKNVQDYSLQCFLQFSQVYSKGFTFLFYFFLLLLLLCVLDLLVWAGRLFIPGLTLRRYLSVISTSPAQMNTFLQRVGVDGRLVIAATADHCDPLAAADVTKCLWHAQQATPQ